MIGWFHSICFTFLVLATTTLTKPFEAAPTIGCFGLICSIHPLASQQCCKTMNRCCGQYQSWLYPLVGTRDTLAEFVRVMHTLDRPRNRSESLGTSGSSIIDNLAVLFADDDSSGEPINVNRTSAKPK
jgi:hypothetical protein